MTVIHRERTARVAHRCAWECGVPIKPGERYVTSSLTPNDPEIGNIGLVAHGAARPEPVQLPETSRGRPLVTARYFRLDDLANSDLTGDQKIDVLALAVAEMGAALARLARGEPAVHGTRLITDGPGGPVLSDVRYDRDGMIMAPVPGEWNDGTQ
jgi:hypothetical protein